MFGLRRLGHHGASDGVNVHQPTDIDLRDFGPPGEPKRRVPSAHSDTAQIDLRTLQVAFASNAQQDNATEAYRNLRTTRVRELGWRDIPAGHHDEDEYDHVERDTFSVLLTRGAEQELLSGIRITRPESDDPMESLSFKMWGDQRREMVLDDQLLALFGERRMIDTTRLFISEMGNREHLLMNLGACLGRTGGTLGAFYTVERRSFLFLQRMTRIRIEVIHRGELGGVSCVLGYIPPLGNVLTLPKLAGGRIQAGARLAGAAANGPLFGSKTNKIDTGG